MNLFKRKFRIVKLYKNGILNEIHAEYKRFFCWKRLKFNYCGATINFSSGNLSLFSSSYYNPYEIHSNEWWGKEELEMRRLLDEWYINYVSPKYDKKILNIN